MAEQNAVERWIEGISNEENRELVRNFDSFNAARGVKYNTRRTYTFILYRLTRAMNKGFKNVIRKDLEDYFARLNGTVTDATMSTHKVIVKKFFQWVYGLDEGYPDIVRWMKSSSGQNSLPDELLTQEDIKKIKEGCDSQRDRALIGMLYEGGFRAEEELVLKIKNVVFDQYGAVIILPKKAKRLKTGQRRIRLIDSAPDLQLWLNMHPLKDDPEAPLWLIVEKCRKGEALKYEGLYALIRKACKRAGLKKKVYPHLFRHSIATERAKNFTEQELKTMFGWSGSSRMAGRYVHLSGADVENKLLVMKGLLNSEKQEMEKKVLEPKKCPRCGTVNPADFKFCGKCSMVLDLRAVMEVEEAKKELNELKKFGIESGTLNLDTGVIDYDKLFDSPTIQKQIQAIEAKLEEKLLARLEERLMKKLGG